MNKMIKTMSIVILVLLGSFLLIGGLVKYSLYSFYDIDENLNKKCQEHYKSIKNNPPIKIKSGYFLPYFNPDLDILCEMKGGTWK